MTNFLRRFRYGIQHTVYGIRNQSGQLLVEILVAITVGGVLLVAATAAMLSVIRNNFESRSTQTSAAIGYDLMSKAKTYASSDWHNIYNLNHGSSYLYYIIPGATSSIAVSGQESVLSNDVAAGLVGHWKFDEATGTTAYDSSGNFNNGALTNGPTRTASSSCQVGSCLGFPASATVSVISSPSISISNKISISLWFYPKNSTAGYASHPIRKWSGTSDANYVMYFFGATSGSQNTIGFYANAGGFWNVVSPQYTTSLNNWYHIAWTYDSAAGGQLYINGSKIGGGVATTGALATNNVNLYVGEDVGDSSFNIDDVRVYNRALSANEISQLYNSSVYTRYFYVSNVSRDTNGNIVTSGGTDDPSTQQITAVTTRADGGTTQLSQYLTRSRNSVFNLTDWSGGSGQDGPISTPTNTFSTSTNITAGSSLTLTSTSGSGNLTSSIIDTQSALGSAINSIVWQGVTNGGTVQFQLAYSNSSSGPWTYGGPTGGGSYYSGGPNASISVTNVNNYRYVRYEIFLAPSGNNSPSVTDIALGWSP